MFRYVVIACAWSAISVIAYFTLSGIGAVYNIYETVAPAIAQPSMATYVHFEHVFAFAAAGLLFTWAYPRHILLVCGIVFGGAILLEILQVLPPDRHATIPDAMEKIAGGAVGITFGRAGMLVSRWLRQ